MNIDLNLLPKGWRNLAQEFVDRARHQFPSIVITDVSANPGGWLSIDFDKHSVPSVEANWRMSKLCEGASSMSWNVCSECGSHRAETWPGRAFAVCDECL